ncbi:MAG: hypothetical protein KDD50_10100 [Bdellovibrionales bacterium]|nr:hypothetical protein [Bdellovibrionales bacterium]
MTKRGLSFVLVALMSSTHLFALPASMNSEVDDRMSYDTYKDLISQCYYEDEVGDYKYRCKTEDLEKIIDHVAKGGDQAFEVNNANVAKAYLYENFESDEEAARFFIDSGGMFTKWIEVNGLGRLHVQDNNFTYKWSLNGPGVRVKNGFNHIIPQRMGLDQPEMKRFLKEGDIIVFWHPETRGDEPDNYNQWRASHAATIVERKNLDGTFSLATADTPAGYARPFDGNDDMPFHVFRFIPRDQNGKPVDNWQEYGKNIAKWASLGFDKFEFNGDYGAMNLKTKYQLDRFKQAYLTGEGFEDEFSMYCAWFVYTNLNLGYYFPFNQKGMGSDWQDQIKKAAINAQRPYQCISKEGLVSGDQDQKCYGSNNEIVPHPGRRSDRELAINFVSAPQLVLNFVNKLLGSDKENLPSSKIGTSEWAKEVKDFAATLKKKAGFFLSSADNFSYNLMVQDSDSRGWDPAISSIDSEEYNRQLKDELANAAFNYDRIGDLVISNAQQILPEIQQLAQNGNLTEAGRKAEELQDKIKQLENQLRGLTATVVNNARTKSAGKAWMPPYGYMAEADHYEEYMTLDQEQESVPQLVYVGTVIHRDLLKNYGEADVTFVNPVADTVAIEEDRDLDWKIKLVLRQVTGDRAIYLSKYFPEIQKSDERFGYKALMWVMIDESVKAAGSKECYLNPEIHEDCYQRSNSNNFDPGLNVYEALALRMAMNAWKFNNLETQEDVVYHNDYGLDPVLVKRAIAAQWNWYELGERALSPAIYGGPTWWATKTAKNTRLLMSLNGEDYPIGLYKDMNRDKGLWVLNYQDHLKNDARQGVSSRRPRRLSYVPCFQGAVESKDKLDQSDWENPRCK